MKFSVNSMSLEDNAPWYLLKICHQKFQHGWLFYMLEIVWTSGTLAQNIRKWQAVNMLMNPQIP
jgi:hypothetical protein